MPWFRVGPLSEEKGGVFGVFFKRKQKFVVEFQTCHRSQGQGEKVLSREDHNKPKVKGKSIVAGQVA